MDNALRLRYLDELLPLGMTIANVAGMIKVTPQTLQNTIRATSQYMRERYPDRIDPRQRDLVQPAVRRRIAELEIELEEAEDSFKRHVLELLTAWIEAQSEPISTVPRRERGAVVLEFVLTLGWSMPVVAKLSGLNPQQIRSVIKTLGGLKAFPNYPTSKTAVFKATYTAYAETLSGRRHPEGITDGKWYCEALADWLKISDLESELTGAATVLKESAGVRCERGHEPWLNFFLDVMEQKPDKLPPIQRTVETVLLKTIKPTEVPASREELCQQAHALLRSYYPEPSRLIWTSQETEALKAVVADLKATNQRHTLQDLYGLETGRPISLQTEANRHGITRSRVGQIKKTALAWMRTRIREDEILLRLRAFLDSERERVITEFEAIRQKNTELQEDLCKTQAQNQTLRGQLARAGVPSEQEVPRDKWNRYLFLCIDEIELSVRSTNCLENAGIEYICQLVVRSEAEMLTIKNFGRKSLNEIKEILNEFGLCLGMKLTGFPWDQTIRYPFS